MKTSRSLLILSLITSVCSAQIKKAAVEPPAKAQAASHSFLLDKRYLCMPLAKNEKKGKESTVRAEIDGRGYFVEPMHFTANGPQWWVSLDVSQSHSPNKQRTNNHEYT